MGEQGMGTMPGRTTPPKQPVLKGAINRLSSMTDSLEKGISELENRLMPVMNDFPKEEREKIPGEDTTIRPPANKVSGAIDEMVNRLDRIVGRIERIKSNLQV